MTFIWPVHSDLEKQTNKKMKAKNNNKKPETEKYILVKEQGKHLLLQSTSPLPHRMIAASAHRQSPMHLKDTAQENKINTVGYQHI